MPQPLVSNPFASVKSSGNGSSIKMTNPFSGAPAPSDGSVKMTNPFAGAAQPVNNAPAKMTNPFAANVTTDTGHKSLAVAMSDNSTPSLPKVTPRTGSPAGNGNILNTIGHSIGAAYHDVAGGLQGLFNSAFNGAPNENPGQRVLQGVNVLLNPLKKIQMVQGAVQGLAHPGQAAQQYATNKQQADAQLGGFPKFLFNFGADTATDPLSYVPFGKAAQVTGVTKAAKAGGDLLKSAIAKSPTATKATNLAKAVFTPLPGTTKEFKQAVSKYYGTRASLANATNQELKPALQGTNAAQRTALTHALEPTKPGTRLADSALEKLRQNVEPITEKAETTAKSHGLIDKTLDTEKMGVGRYLPHIREDKFSPEGYRSNGRMLKTTVDAAKERTIQGTIKDINEKGGKTKFESDALKVLGYHLHQMNNAIAAKQLIDDTMKHGLESGGDHGLEAGDLHPDTKTPLAEYTHDGKTVLLPKAEVDFLNGITAPKTEAQKTVESLGNGYRKIVNLANQAMFLKNPFIHIGPNLGWQTLVHAPGAFPKIIKQLPEAFKGVQPGSVMDDALKHGALNLSSEIGTKGTVAERVKDLEKAVDHPTNWKNPLSAAKQLAKTYVHLTPTVEKAYRAGMFQHATEDMGKSPEDAADFIRSIYGGHIAPNAASIAEKSLRAVDPFINWTKTAMVSNAKNALERPWIYSGVAHALNAINQQNTGHGQLQNANPLYTSLPETNAQGWQKQVMPYFPAMDDAKLAKSMATEGPFHGTLDFLYSRSNPVIKTATQFANGHQNPTAPVQNQFQIDPYAGNSLVPSWAHRQAYINQALQNFSLQGVGAKPTNVTPLDRILGALGSTVNAPNPQSPTKEAQYNQRNNRSGYKRWLKQQAQSGK